MIEGLQGLSEGLSVWHVTRAAGLTSFLLLFLAVAGGLIQATGLLPSSVQSRIAVLHTTAGWLALLFGLVHGLVLVFDHYVGYSLTEIFLPFLKGRQPWLMTAGIAALYGMLSVNLTSDWKNLFGFGLWRSVHYLSLPAYFLALYHGVAMGSDKAEPAINNLYWGSLLIVLVLLVLRFSLAFAFRKGVTYENPAGGR